MKNFFGTCILFFILKYIKFNKKSRQKLYLFYLYIVYMSSIFEIEKTINALFWNKTLHIYILDLDWFYRYRNTNALDKIKKIINYNDIRSIWITKLKIKNMMPFDAWVTHYFKYLCNFFIVASRVKIEWFFKINEQRYLGVCIFII